MWRIAPMALLLCILAPVFAVAEEIDMTNCRAGTVTVLHADKEFRVLSIDIKGVAFSRNGDRLIDKTASHCIGLIRVTKEGSASNGYCKYADPDGDTFVVEWTGLGPDGGPWSFVGGTGKWVGVKGSGDWRPTTQIKPIAPGTLQSCNVVTGTYTLAN